VNPDFISIVEELDGCIFIGGMFENVHLRVVKIPFNREFYIGCFRRSYSTIILKNEKERIYFVDVDGIDYGHSHYKKKYKYGCKFLQWVPQPNWIPGEIRTVFFNEYENFYPVEWLNQDDYERDF
jgi:hypothetical protein